jgi:hypothetical protein
VCQLERGEERAAGEGGVKLAQKGTNMDATRVALTRIRTDGGTQSRDKLSDEAIVEYTKVYASKPNDMPPIVVFYDGEEQWLADGFHRVKAALAAGRSTIRAEVKQGTQRDAILYSVGANNNHGQRRSTADKRRAVLMLLHDDEWGKRSDRWIAEKCGVDHVTVANRRAELVNFTSSSTSRAGQDGKMRKLPSPAKRREPSAAPMREDAPFDPAAEFAPPTPALVERRAPPEFAEVIPLNADSARELAEQSALPPAVNEFADELHPMDALAELDEDIRRHIAAWRWPPGDLVAAIEGWARKARLYFQEREDRKHG